jgi:hypothetical protein
VAIQPNSHDCGYHVVLNSRLLADFVLGFNVEGGDEISLIPQELCCQINCCRGRGPPGVLLLEPASRFLDLS